MINIFKKIKLQTIDNTVFFSKPVEELPDLLLSPFFTIKIFDKDFSNEITLSRDREINNSICYAVYKDDELIHESWVFKSKLLATQLGYKRKFIIGNSVTKENYRGQGIYPFILHFILKNNPDKKFIIFTDVSNNSSEKGILKAGFFRVYRFKLIRLLGIKIYLRRYDY